MDIKSYVEKRKCLLREDILSKGRKPVLLIIQVNDDPASKAYVKGKLKDAAEIGADAILDKLPETTTEEELLRKVEKANADDSIDGLIVQLPLPRHISEEKIKLAIAPSKDVDGFHPLSKCDPCTPKGIIDYLRDEGFAFKGANAVVIGRSNIVGKPMAKLLTKNDCNVTVLHSKTTSEDMRFYVKHADLVVIAIGKAGFLDGSFEYKENAVIVDVGITRGEDGKLHGDALPGLPVKLQTPVPGGVGLLTRISLMANLLEVSK